MSGDGPSAESDQRSDRLAGAFPDCARIIHRELVAGRRRSRSKSRTNAFWFRLVGASEIIGAASLPVLFTLLDLSIKSNQVVLTALSVLVAATAALSGFFGWQAGWQSYSTQELDLAELLANWEISLLQLESMPDAEERQRLALAETRATVNRAAAIMREGSEQLHQGTRLAKAIIEDFERRTRQAAHPNGQQPDPYVDRTSAAESESAFSG